MAFKKTARVVGRPRRSGRPVDASKLEAIVEASWTLFLKHGVEAVSFEAVAAKAGVSKATLYKHYPDKATLFEAGVLREMEKIEAAQLLGAQIQQPCGLEETLRRFGIGIMAFLFSESAVDFYSAIAGELRRYPDLARRFYAMGPGRTRANLAGILTGAAARGELAIANPEQAAEHLFGLWQGFSNFQLSLGVEERQLAGTLEARVDGAISVFLQAYAPDPHHFTTSITTSTS